MNNSDITGSDLGMVPPWNDIPSRFLSPIPCLQVRNKDMNNCYVQKELIEGLYKNAELAKLHKNDDYAQIWEVIARNYKTSQCCPFMTAEDRDTLQETMQLTTTCSKQDAKNIINQYNNCMNCYTPIPTSSDLSTGAIAGIVVSSVILLALIIFLIWYVSKYNHKHR